MTWKRPKQGLNELEGEVIRMINRTRKERRRKEQFQKPEDRKNLRQMASQHRSCEAAKLNGVGVGESQSTDLVELIANPRDSTGRDAG